MANGVGQVWGVRLPLAVLAVVCLTAGGVLYAVYLPALPSVTTTGGVVTSDVSGLFPRGYYSHAVNFSLTHSGDAVVVAGYSFLYTVPTNLETRTMTVGTGSSTSVTTVVVTADYQCGSSLGQRRFFFAHAIGSQNSTTYALDYCLLLNSAVAQGALQGGVPHPWDLWEVVPSSPLVAIHMSGTGEHASLVELCVSK